MRPQQMLSPGPPPLTRCQMQRINSGDCGAAAARLCPENEVCDIYQGGGCEFWLKTRMETNVRDLRLLKIGTSVKTPEGLTEFVSSTSSSDHFQSQLGRPVGLLINT